MPNLVSLNLISQSPDISQNTDGDISDIWISGQSLLKIAITLEPAMILPAMILT